MSSIGVSPDLPGKKSVGRIEYQVTPRSRSLAKHFGRSKGNSD
jgi:hypothetical protein